MDCQPSYFPHVERDYETDLRTGRRIGLLRKWRPGPGKEVDRLLKEISDKLKESFWCEKHKCRLLKTACASRKERAEKIFEDKKMKNSIGLALKESFGPCHNCQEGE